MAYIPSRCLNDARAHLSVGNPERALAKLDGCTPSNVEPINQSEARHLARWYQVRGDALIATDNLNAAIGAYADGLRVTNRAFEPGLFRELSAAALRCSVAEIYRFTAARLSKEPDTFLKAEREERRDTIGLYYRAMHHQLIEVGNCVETAIDVRSGQPAAPGYKGRTTMVPTELGRSPYGYFIRAMHARTLGLAAIAEGNQTEAEMSMRRSLTSLDLWKNSRYSPTIGSYTNYTWKKGFRGNLIISYANDPSFELFTTHIDELRAKAMPPSKNRRFNLGRFARQGASPAGPQITPPIFPMQPPLSTLYELSD